MKPLSELLSATPVEAAGGDLEVPVSGIYYDSRAVRPGGLFVAVPGFRTDGHRFLADAVARGAAAVVVERREAVPAGVAWAEVASSRRALGELAAAFYGHPAARLRLYGVTGTNGKTTTTHLIRAVLEAGGRTCGLVGTVGAQIGEEQLGAARTTPEASDLQELLARMRDRGLSGAVLEVSSHALELERLRGCAFDVGVFTNLTPDHLDFHRDMGSYLAAKAKLFRLLDPERSGSQYAVLNADDPASTELAAVTRVPVITYGLQSRAEVRAENLGLDPAGVAFDLHWPGGRCRVRLALTGRFNVYNALAAWVVGWQEGMEPEAVNRALATVRGVPGRFERVEAGQDFTVLVDYAHTPDGLLKVLEAARGLTRGRVILVFGCGGDRDRTKRPQMGAVAARHSDLSVITSDNPRSEDPLAIIEEIRAGYVSVRRDGYRVEPDRYRAIELALGLADRDDVVLIAGKGHETCQIIGDRILPFDDRQVVREILSGRGNAGGTAR
ncbi:MAG: UDP-N-acetylmuramoyl-L-alanyl-D-glutamate--2,6-diaminopimelate ligase [Clostridia bacterium]|jgi:UDP-N-acetylmuramoyl-L-alanyl-D-glutamate--2,6-diaminopimelate ligase|nr:UDP-N-acetylmuramoyl-L-alanyl-D-glutamate--2,6-diaminopimelate ligase [Clostridia bacterium]MDH7573307.1 UDP-N-acetylmuramoyl-L-alanyl-D-glutamate--2,6-diaminopimelate ligase [Clostridia bacterium]